MIVWLHRKSILASDQWETGVVSMSQSYCMKLSNNRGSIGPNCPETMREICPTVSTKFPLPYLVSHQPHREGEAPWGNTWRTTGGMEVEG